MATDGKVTIQIDARDGKAVSAAKKVTSSLNDIKKADAGLSWSGLDKGASSAQMTNNMVSAMSVALGNLAAQGMSAVLSKTSQLAQQVVTIGSGFETSMSKVSALSGAQGEELDKLESKARELGASTTFSASQAADALGYMALAGWDTQQMLEGVDSVLTLAQAGEMDLAAASDLVTDYLSAFNMEASDTQRMVDVLAYSQANANTTVEGLGMAYKNCAANCNAFGMDVETTSSAIAMMANQGLKGQEAGTALNAVMRDMTARMKDGAIAIGKTAVQVMDAEGNYRDFIDILADVQAATDGMGDAEKAVALQSTFTADSINGLNLLLNAGAGQAATFREELYGCAGTAERTAKTMTDNLGGDVAAMGSAFEELAIKVYQELQGPLRETVQFITSTVIPGLEWMLQNLDKIGPVLVGVGSGLAIVANRQKLIDAGKATWATLTAETTKYESAVSRSVSTVSSFGMKARTAAADQAKMTTAIKASTIGLKAQTGAVKASTVAMNLGRVAVNGLKAALATIAPIAIMTALVEVATHISGAYAEAEKHTSGLASATKGLEDAASGATVVLDDETDALQNVDDTAKAIDFDQLIDDHNSLAASITETNQSAAASTGLLDGYKSTIADLAGSTELSDEKVAELKLAIDGVNEACGTSYVAAQDAEGAWQILSDGAIVAKESITKLIDAQMAQIRLDATKESYKSTYEQLSKDAEAHATALADVTEKQKAFDDAVATLGENRFYTDMNGFTQDLAAEQQSALDVAKKNLSEVEQQYGATQSAANRLEEQQKLTTMAMAEGASEIVKLVDGNVKMKAAIQQTGTDLVGFTQALESMGFTTEQVAALEPEKAAQLAQGWQDGTLGMIQACEDAGIAIPETLATMGAKLQEDLTAFGAATSGQLDAFKGSFDGTLQSIVDTCDAQGIAIPETLAAAIASAQNLPEDAQRTMMTALVLQMTNGDPEAAAQILGENIDQGLMDGIQSGDDLPKEAIGVLSDEVIDRAKAHFDSHSPSRVMEQLGSDIDAGLANGISDNTSGPTDAMALVGNDILSALQGLPDALGFKGTGAAERLAAGVATGQGSASAAAFALSKLVADHFSSASGDAWWAGYNMAATSFGPGVAAGRDPAVSEADTTSKHVADHFSSSNGDAWWAGYNMALGLAQGIAAGRSDAVNAARDVAAAAVTAAKEEAVIQSPSKVMKRIGRYFTEGLAIGIRQEAPLATAAAQYAMGGAIKGATAPRRVPLDINWYATTGRYNTLSALGIQDVSHVTAPTLSRTSATQAQSVGKGDIHVTIVIEHFEHSGSEVDDEALVRRIAQKVGEEMRGMGRRW